MAMQPSYRLKVGKTLMFSYVSLAQRAQFNLACVGLYWPLAMGYVRH